MGKVFVSYAHADEHWVVGRLEPVLDAAGVEVLIDHERFRAGAAVEGEIERCLDGAERRLLVLSQAALASHYCRHEHERALVARSDGAAFGVIPVRRDDAAWPEALARLIHVDLRDDQDEAAWARLLHACGADLRVPAPAWLGARQEIQDALARGESANLVASGALDTRALIKRLRTADGARLVPDVAVVDLHDGRLATRWALLEAILAAWGGACALPRRPAEALVEFTRLASARPPGCIALLNFDWVTNPERQRAYGADLHAALRTLNHTERRLTLLVESRRPFQELIPDLHGSPWSMRIVRLAHRSGA